MLTVSELSRPAKKRAERNHETYKMLYTRCTDHIRRVAANAPDVRSVTWYVPAVVPGRGMYNHAHAARYVTEKLERGGFTVRPGAEGFSLHVSWTLDRRPEGRSGSSGSSRRSRRTETLSDRLDRVRRAFSSGE